MTPTVLFDSGARRDAYLGSAYNHSVNISFTGDYALQARYERMPVENAQNACRPASI